MNGNEYSKTGFNIGDNVTHVKYGNGIITQMRYNSYELNVKFECGVHHYFPHYDIAHMN